MPKKNPHKTRLTRTARAQIIAEANAKGWTAGEVAKKYGVSPWTYYGWRKAKRGGTKRAANTAKKPATPKGRAPRADRAMILAEMNRTGATADQMAKKYRVSRWTIYGWRKRKSGGAKGAAGGRTTGARATGTTGTPEITAAALQSEIRAMLPTILREEIASALRGLVGTRTNGRRRRSAKKK